MKKIYLIFGIIFGIVLVSAVTFTFTNTPVEYAPEIAPVITPETVVYKCDGVTQYVEHYEKVWDANDVKSITRQNCSGTINQILIGGKQWRKYNGKEGFEADVRQYECADNQNKTLYDSNTNNCIATPKDLVQAEV